MNESVGVKLDELCVQAILNNEERLAQVKIDFINPGSYHGKVVFAVTSEQRMESVQS